jgi:hypothetical protein
MGMFGRRYFYIVTLIIYGLFSTADSQSPRFSADGDTAYIGQNAAIRTDGHEHPSTFGAMLGTAPQGTIANTNWGPEVRLTHTQDSTGGITQNPFGTVWQDTLFIAFDLHTSWSGGAPFLLKSSDAGETWSDPWSITNPDTAQDATNLFINLYNGRLNTAGVVVWTNQFDYSNIYTKCSADFGQSWSTPYFFFPRGQQFIGKYGGTSFKDSLITGFYYGQDSHSLTVDSISLTHSFNNGQSWSGATNAVYYRNDSYWFWLRYSQGKVHLVYQEHSWNSGNTEIFYSRSSDWGGSWSIPIVVSDDSAAIGQFPYLFATNDGRLIVSWYDYKYGSGGGGFTGDILYRLSTDNGDSWGPELRLTYNQAATESRSFILGNHIGMVWVDCRTGFFTPELYYAESSDMGQTWGEEERLTDAPGSSDQPDLLLAGNQLFLFWMDSRDDSMGGKEIYFRKADVEVGVDDNDAGLILPNKIELSAYPNPFNSRTILSINEKDKAQILIFDITGRLVTSLNADQGKAVWEAKGYSSGVYFARARGENSASIKLILLK